MRRRKITDKRRWDLSQVRFFLFLPTTVRDSLSTDQKRAIARTILELQRNDPRILDEIYMEMPYRGRQPGEFSFWGRVNRRAGWLFRRFWLSMLKQKGEHRMRWRMADYVFIAFVAFMLIFLGFGMFMLFYGLKSMLGIDLIKNVHFFTVG